MDGVDLAVLGGRIKALREERRWEQVELARHAGVDKGTISRIEAGKRGMTLKTLQSLAAALGVPVEQLVHGAPASASMPAQQPQDYVSGFKEGWKDGWDAAVEMLRGGRSGNTRSRR